MPDWIPGKQRGEKVNVKYAVPIRFKLSEDEISKNENQKAEIESKLPINFKLYPNPAVNDLTIEVLDAYETLSYQILTSSGQVAIEGMLLSEEEKIDIFDLESGIYIVRVYSEELGVFGTNKLVVSK